MVECAKTILKHGIFILIFMGFPLRIMNYGIFFRVENAAPRDELKMVVVMLGHPIYQGALKVTDRAQNADVRTKTHRSSQIRPFLLEIQACGGRLSRSAQESRHLKIWVS